MNEEYRGFYEDLIETVDSHSGRYKELLQYCPKFFQLLCKILNDPRTDWNTKLLCNSALAYFVLPEDIIPDNEEEGYIDDLFICAFVLVEIKTNIDKSLLVNNWEYNENILRLVEEVQDKTKIIIGEKYLDILQLIGLRKYVSLDLNENSGEHSKKMSRLAEEKRELIGLLSFVLNKMYSFPRTRNMNQLRDYFKSHQDYGEVMRIVNIAKAEREVDNGEIIEDSEDFIRKQRIRDIMRGRK